jgi:hypothetical protein
MHHPHRFATLCVAYVTSVAVWTAFAVQLLAGLR